MKYLNPETGETATVKGVDDRTNLAAVVITNKKGRVAIMTIDWDIFLSQFKNAVNEYKNG